MDPKDELLKRVRDDAQAIAALASHGLNVPVENFIDKNKSQCAVRLSRP